MILKWEDKDGRHTETIGSLAHAKQRMTGILEAGGKVTLLTDGKVSVDPSLFSGLRVDNNEVL